MDILNLKLKDLVDEGKGLFKSIVADAVEEVLNNRSNDVGEKRLSRTELCERWHISAGTLNNRIKEKVIEPIQLGRRVLFSLDDILAAEANGYVRR